MLKENILSACSIETLPKGADSYCWASHVSKIDYFNKIGFEICHTNSNIRLGVFNYYPIGNIRIMLDKIFSYAFDKNMKKIWFEDTISDEVADVLISAGFTEGESVDNFRYFEKIL